MWHHKTKLGTFWIVESEENHEYYLGMDDNTLAHYKKLEDAINDIKKQETGHLRWDMSRNSAIPEDISEWDDGEPENWMAS